MISEDTCKNCKAGVVVKPHATSKEHSVLHCENNCGTTAHVISTDKISPGHSVHAHFNITEASAYEKYLIK